MLWEIFVIMVLFGLVFLSFLPLVNRTNDAGENFFKVPYCLVVFVLVAGLGASHHLGSKHLAWFDAENFEKFETSKIRVGKCSSTLPKLLVDGCNGYATFTNKFTPTEQEKGDAASISFETRVVFPGAVLTLDTCADNLKKQMDAYYIAHKIDDDGDGRCYSFAYVLPPTFLADWTPNTMSWTQWFFNTYKKDDNVYGSLGEIMNETETYWARSSRSIFAHSVQIGLSLWSFALLLWPIIATYESIEARKKTD